MRPKDLVLFRVTVCLNFFKTLSGLLCKLVINFKDVRSCIVQQYCSMYFNLDLLPAKPKFSFRHLKQGIQEFQRKYVLVPAYTAANVVIVWRLHCVNPLIQELGSIKTNEHTSSDEKSIVDNLCYHVTTKFAVGIKENQEQLWSQHVYLKFPNIIAEPKYKYGQQEQVTVRSHNRSTALKRPVLKYWGGGA